MSDVDRSRIDSELKSNLAQARAKIGSIKQAFLSQDDGGARADADAADHRSHHLQQQEQQHCESTIQILLQLLYRVGLRVKRKRKARLERVVRQMKARALAPEPVLQPVHFIDKERGDGGAGGGGGRIRLGADDDGGDADVDVDQAELEELWQEQVAMRRSHETEMDEVRECVRTLAEIGEMMTSFTAQLELQSEVVADIQESAEAAVDEMSQANEYLRRTVDSNNTFRLFMILFFVGTSLSLLAYEWISG